MKKWISKLNTYFKVALFSFLSIIVIFLCTVFLYFLNLGDIPNGFLLGALTQIIFYLILGLIDKKENEKNGYFGAIIVGALRLLVFLGVAIGNAYLYYKTDFKVFNPIAVFVGYPIPLIWLVICYLKGKKDARSN